MKSKSEFEMDSDSNHVNHLFLIHCLQNGNSVFLKKTSLKTMLSLKRLVASYKLFELFSMPSILLEFSSIAWSLLKKT
jgi:hypothetical protein